MADELLQSMQSERRNDKHRAQWKMTLNGKMTLNVHAALLRERSAHKIDTEAIISSLWAGKPETASRFRRLAAAIGVAGLPGALNACGVVLCNLRVWNLWRWRA
jgi:hypothetical protein